MTKQEDIRRIIWQLVERDNWNVVDDIEHFLYVFDNMPKQMRLVVDLRLTGHSNQEIANILKTTQGVVRKQLSRAKTRILKVFSK